MPCDMPRFQFACRSIVGDCASRSRQRHDMRFVHKQIFHMPPRIRKEFGDQRRKWQRQQPRADQGDDPKTRERGQHNNQNGECYEFD